MNLHYFKRNSKAALSKLYRKVKIFVGFKRISLPNTALPDVLRSPDRSPSYPISQGTLDSDPYPIHQTGYATLARFNFMPMVR